MDMIHHRNQKRNCNKKDNNNQYSALK